MSESMKRNTLILLFLVVFLIGLFTARLLYRLPLHLKMLTDYVDPFIGTGGHGHTYPGATLPFGMVQLSPDTRLTGWDGCSGYHYDDTVIYGFSHTHLSGTGIPDYCDVMIMPTVGKYQLNSGYIDPQHETNKGYGSSFDKKTEIAKPGYYSVFLKDYKIKVELTTTYRCGFHRYIYPKTDSANVILDLTHRDKVLASGLRVIGNHVVQGYRISSSWAKKQYVFFYMVFSKPIKKYFLFRNDTLVKGQDSLNGMNVKAAFYFDTRNNDTLLVKVGISAVDTAGARKNLQAELPGWNFDQVVQAADIIWNKELSRIIITGPDSVKTKFYTALYHTMVVPNLFMDVDRRYRGTDLKIHKAKNFVNYTVFSLWDTYRACHPLYTIIEPSRDLQFIRTFLHQYLNGGWLPMWELAGNYTHCMIGYHAVPVIYDAYQKGIRGFDARLALKAMVKSATRNQWGIPAYERFGFIPANYAAASVSRTLEYSYDDWCIAQMAKSLGIDSIYRRFIERAQYWKNVFDPQTSFMRAKYDAVWVSPFNPYEVNAYYTEANAWQYRFSVPQDIKTLVEYFGGEKAFGQSLDSLFHASPHFTGISQPDITGMIGQYAHGNEPSHHLAYMFVFAGQPYKTQRYVRYIMDNFYTTKPNGYIGNEDCGQMSAWLVLSALGFYPVTPGAGYFVIGSPLIRRAVINLENGRKFEIVVRNQSVKNVYVKKVLLNGHELKSLRLDYGSIMNGGKLVFVMSDKPSSFGSKSIPWTQITEHLITPAPFVYPVPMSFADSLTIRLGDLDKKAVIYYSFDSAGKYVRYTKPLVLRQTATIYFYAERPGYVKSKLQFAHFVKYDANIGIKLFTHYAPMYAAGGDRALIDGLEGTNNFRLGRWQGYQGVNLDVMLDLRKVQTVRGLKIRFLQDVGAWIFMPLEVKFYYSSDAKQWHEWGKMKNKVDSRDYTPQIEVFSVNRPVRTRYIRIIAVNRGKCPSWHPGAGHKAWIFADEIKIEK